MICFKVYRIIEHEIFLGTFSLTVFSSCVLLLRQKIIRNYILEEVRGVTHKSRVSRPLRLFKFIASKCAVYGKAKLF